jgi:hypothetical protein
MADRKKKRKGRNPAASKPKAEARVAASVGPMGRLPTGGGWGELTEPVPFEGMSGTGGRATPETHTVTVDYTVDVKTLASVYTADAEVPARSGRSTRKRTTGTRPARRETIAAIRRQADVAEAALKKLAPPHTVG